MCALIRVLALCSIAIADSGALGVGRAAMMGAGEWGEAGSGGGKVGCPGLARRCDFLVKGLDGGAGRARCRRVGGKVK
ncbi:hypothetical protein GCM10010321_87270 [Streptomyces chartreusis]|nr:hypothetical protein GCM10010321_87270 [Streptomyces chartreusis]